MKYLKLRSLKLHRKEDFPAMPGLLKKVQEKIIKKIYEYLHIVIEFSIIMYKSVNRCSNYYQPEYY